MIGQGFPLIGAQQSRSFNGLRMAPAPFSPPIDFPMRGGYGYQQTPAPSLPGTPGAAQPPAPGSSRTPNLPGGGGARAGLLGAPGGRQRFGGAPPILDPFARVTQRRKAGSGMILGAAR